MESMSPKEQLLVDVLESFKKEHAEETAKWHELDRKAQGVAAISGVFIAGILVFVRELKEGPETATQLLLTIAVISIFCGVSFALRSLSIRRISEAPLGETLEKMTKDVINMSLEANPSRRINFYRDQTRSWDVVNKQIKKANDDKVSQIVRAQWSIMSTIVCLIIVVILHIWGT